MQVVSAAQLVLALNPGAIHECAIPASEVFYEDLRTAHEQGTVAATDKPTCQLKAAVRSTADNESGTGNRDDLPVQLPLGQYKRGGSS